MVELLLYLREEKGKFKVLKVPIYVVKDLIRDRLGKSEIERIHRLAEPTSPPEAFGPGSVVVDFPAKSAQYFQTGLKIEDLEPTWNVTNTEEKPAIDSYPVS